jgi:YVTN family beta-propeller protein
MKRWEYLLQDKEGNPGTGDRTVFTWEEWDTVGEDGIKMSSRKVKVGEGPEVAIAYPMIQMSREANEAVMNPSPPPATAPPNEATGTAPEEAGISAVLVVLNKSDHTAALVDPKTLEVVRLVPTGIGPHEAAVSHDGKTLYVANYGTRRPGNTISVIDIPSGEVLRVAELGENGRPHGIAVASDGALWVTTEESQSLLRLSPQDLSIQDKYVTGENVTHMVVLTPDGSRAFTANIGSGSVSVVDVADGSVKNIQTGEGAEGIDISPDGEEVWVAHRNENNVVILDARTLEKKETVATGEFPIRVRMTPDGERVLVSCAVSNELVVYDRGSRKESNRVSLEETPIGILVTPDGTRAFVANTQTDKVSVIDLKEMKVVGSIAPGREPDGLAWAAW